MGPERFWASVFLFHLVMVGVGLAVGRGWALSVARREGPRAWALRLVRDAFLFGLAAVAAGGVALLAPWPLFTLLRLLCQAAFGEAVVLAAWVAGLHAWRRQWLRAAVPALAAVGILGVYWEAYHRGPRDLRVRHHVADLSRGSSQPRTLRILHLSDIQTHQVGPHEEQAFRRGLAERPDLIVFTGDYVEERLAPTGAKAAADLRALLRAVELAAPLGVFATDGDTGPRCRAVFEGLDVTCLVDEARRVELPGGASLALVGLSVRASRTRSPERLLRVLEGAPPADLRIVAGHSPDFVAALAGRARVDLALAGHTHGGQVVIPFFGPPLTFSRLPRRYAADLHDYGGILLHVSRGIGMERGTAPQIRFLCPPEVCVLDVRY